MKRQILFTINTHQTDNARTLAENQNGKEYKSVQEFIDTLLQYELIQEESEVVIYELYDFVQEFNTFPTGETLNDDAMRECFMGFLTIGE